MLAKRLFSPEILQGTFPGFFFGDCDSFGVVVRVSWVTLRMRLAGVVCV